MFHRIPVLVVLLLIGCKNRSAILQQQIPGRRPNFILIISDQQSKEALGVYGNDQTYTELKRDMLYQLYEKNVTEDPKEGSLFTIPCD